MFLAEETTHTLEMLIEQRMVRAVQEGLVPGSGHALPCGSQHGFESQCDLEALEDFEQHSLMVSVKVLKCFY